MAKCSIQEITKKLVEAFQATESGSPGEAKLSEMIRNGIQIPETAKFRRTSFHLHWGDDGRVMFACDLDDEPHTLERWQFEWIEEDQK